MKNHYSLMGLAAGITALLLTTSCSKQESSGTPAADTGKKQPTAVATENSQAVEAPKAPDTPPAASAQQAPVAPANLTAATVAPVAASQPEAQPQKPAVAQSVAAPAVVSAANPAGAQAVAVQTTSQPQQLSLAQTATNQYQTLAGAATTRALAAMATTNQVAATGTNQVAVLLDRAKTLTANQKYQEALSTLTQLYNNKLTPEQKQQADALKDQVQTAIAQKATSGAASALGNILGGKKQ